MTCLCKTFAGEGLDLSPVCIGWHWVFDDLQSEERAALADRAFREIHTAGATIFWEGDPANKMFLIKAGRVKLSKLLEDGTEITLDLRKGGDFLGENMLSGDTCYPVSATSMAETLICGFTKERFERLVLDYPNIGLKVIKNLSKRITLLTGRVGSLSLTTLTDRLYNVLVSVSREHGVKAKGGFTIPFPMTHEALGFLVGAHRVSITRAMKDLKKTGKIVQEGRKVIICGGQEL
jgi:CRP-like cAMP-binding protein